MRLVRVVTKIALGLWAATMWISLSRSSDLRFHRADLDFGVKQGRWARMICSANTPPACSSSHFLRGGRNEHRARAHGIPFLEFKRAVIHAAGQPKSRALRGFDLRLKSPLYMPPIWGTLTWLSSAKNNGINRGYTQTGWGGGSPGIRPVR